MEKNFLVFIFLFSLGCYSQDIGYIKPLNDSILQVSSDGVKELRIIVSTDDLSEGRAIKFTPCRNGITQVKGSTIMYESNCEKKLITFYIEGHREDAIDIYYCERDNKFFDNLTKFRLSCVTEDKAGISEYGKITNIPQPSFLQSFSKESEIPKDSQNRILFIDASSYPFHNFHTVLTKGNPDFKEAKAVNKNGHLMIFIKNFNASQISKFTVALNEFDYVYENDFEIVRPKSGAIDTSGINKKGGVEGGVKDSDLIYLKEFYESLDSVKSISSHELQQLEIFKAKLSQTIEVNSLKLSPSATAYYYAIVNWSPVWINLTPLALAVPNTDQVTIKISATGKDGEQLVEPTVVGNHMVIGGWVFDLGGRFYTTGLKNNEAYVATNISNGTEGRFARVKEKDQLSIGYGINAEMSLRTGSVFRPTLNLGSFIPFEEEINPYLAVGPGFNYRENM